jgi:hypothetical protein
MGNGVLSRSVKALRKGVAMKQQTPVGEQEESMLAGKRQVILGFIVLLLLLALSGALIYFILVTLWPPTSAFFASLSSLDSAIIVALITGAVSALSFFGNSVVNSVAKKREYLRVHREEPYMRLISLVYDFQAAASKGAGMADDELEKILMQFNKELTLWGSSKAIQAWGNWRRCSSSGSVDPLQNLFGMEKVMIQLRKDMGMRRGIRKGDLLRLMVSDIDSFLK